MFTCCVHQTGPPVPAPRLPRLTLQSSIAHIQYRIMDLRLWFPVKLPARVNNVGHDRQTDGGIAQLYRNGCYYVVRFYSAFHRRVNINIWHIWHGKCPKITYTSKHVASILTYVFAWHVLECWCCLLNSHCANISTDNVYFLPSSWRTHVELHVNML